MPTSRDQTRGADDGRRADPPGGGLDRDDLVPEHGDPVERRPLEDGDALRRRDTGVGLHDRFRRGVAVDRAVGGREQVGGLERRDHRLDVVRRDQPRRDAETRLELDRGLEALDVDLVREHEEVAVALVPDAADPLERLELGHRAERHPDVELVRELCADAACGLARRAAPERLLLEQDDVGDALLGQVVRDARPHGAAADDHDVCGLGHPHEAISSCGCAGPRHPRICEDSRRERGRFEPFGLTPEQREIRDVCREFADREIRPIAADVDEADVETPWEVWARQPGSA